jgi:small nuclear ribonucleoprotein (snRNP)-like protein
MWAEAQPTIGGTVRAARAAKPRRSQFQERVAKKQDDSMLTLNTMLRSMIGAQLTIDLRDDTSLCGRLEEADAYMNLSLSDVAITPPVMRRGAPPGFRSTLYVKGCSIRFVHLPAELDAAALIRERFKSIEGGKRAFSKRIPKPAAPVEVLPPIVSEHVVVVSDDGAGVA